MKKLIKRIFIVLLLVGAAVGAFGLWILYGSKTTNPSNYATVGDIPTPSGYERIGGDDRAYSEYLRSLPLKGRGAKAQLYTGGDSKYQSICYAVVDMPLLSNAEQCADVCMRLRAEYLYNTGQYGKIHFQNVDGHTMRYGGGASRKAFERYLRRVYLDASTYSMSRELPIRPLADMQPGDVFVYPSPDGKISGHAVMVVDVAQNADGKKAFLLAEGNTPAREIHVMRNFLNPLRSPWFMLDENSSRQTLSVFPFRSTDLKHY